ncbi:unnamed protein product [Urochloa humidicola]
MQSPAFLTPPLPPEPPPFSLHRRRAGTRPSPRKRRQRMRAVVQRVLSASVEVEGRVVSAIGPGLLVLVGVHEADTESDADYICRKILNMRLFPNDKTGKAWDQSVKQRNFEVLLDGIFGAMMKVSLVNDGPVTMQVDSPSLQGAAQSSNGDDGLLRDGEA